MHYYTEVKKENDVKTLSPDYLIERSKWTHFYVVCEDEKIIGCGAIGAYWGKENEYFLRARRIEIPASITACSSYKKMGYDYKDGIDTSDNEQLYRLEKFR